MHQNSKEINRILNSVSCNSRSYRRSLIKRVVGLLFLTNYDTILSHSESINHRSRKTIRTESNPTISEIICHLTRSYVEYDYTSINTNITDRRLNNVFRKRRKRGHQSKMATISTDGRKDEIYSCQPVSEANFYRKISELHYTLDARIVETLPDMSKYLNQIVRLTGVQFNEATASTVVADRGSFSIKVLENYGHFNTTEISEINQSSSQEDEASLVAVEGRRKREKNDTQQKSDSDEESVPTVLDETALKRSNSSSVTVSNPTEQSKTMGIRRVLIIRIIGKDSKPTLSTDDLIRYTFSEDVSLKNQMHKCSAGQLVLVPATIGDNDRGVIDVTLHNSTIQGQSREALVNLALTALEENFAAFLTNNSTITNETIRHGDINQNGTYTTNLSQGSVLLDDIADLIMVIVPPGSLPHSWAAYGVVNGRLTVFNDDWAGYISTTMHEVGHNLGLYHSREKSTLFEYDGESGYMGAAMKEYLYPQKCYNSQNHWHLGWFRDKTIEVSSLDFLLSGPVLLHIAAFVDYQTTKISSVTEDEYPFYVLARIHDDYYIQYNRAKEHNIGTTELGDQLVIVYHDATTGGTIELVGIDLESPLYRIAITDEEDTSRNKDLVFEVCSIMNGDMSLPDYIVISIGYNIDHPCQAFQQFQEKSFITASPTTPVDAPQQRPLVLSQPPISPPEQQPSAPSKRDPPSESVSLPHHKTSTSSETSEQSSTKSPSKKHLTKVSSNFLTKDPMDTGKNGYPTEVVSNSPSDNDLTFENDSLPTYQLTIDKEPKSSSGLEPRESLFEAMGNESHIESYNETSSNQQQNQQQHGNNTEASTIQKEFSTITLFVLFQIAFVSSLFALYVLGVRNKLKSSTLAKKEQIEKDICSLSNFHEVMSFSDNNTHEPFSDDTNSISFSSSSSAKSCKSFC